MVQEQETLYASLHWQTDITMNFCWKLIASESSHLESDPLRSFEEALILLALILEIFLPRVVFVPFTKHCHSSQ